ncbi:hypothetical protein [Streptomyces venezuelae]|uniref:hypothetical protein n=1 Tax=Streptomyces venezuelae TaxID=54571 RepID=UPI003657AAD6
MTDLSMSPHTGDTTQPYPSELLAAIQIACRMLDAFGTIDYRDSAAASSAHGALTESLRILLRALGAEPDRTARVAKLHRLCADDYAAAATRRQQDNRDDADLIAEASETAVVHRSVDDQFPLIAAFLADERGGQ